MTTNNYKAQAGKAFNRLRDEIDDSPASFFVAITILLILCAIFLKVLYFNAEPFLLLVGATMPQPSNIPIIGWAYDVLNLLYLGTGGVTIWTLTQLAEVGWIFVALDRKAHRASIKQAQKEQDYYEQSSSAKDDRYIRKMRRRGLKLPFFYKAVAGYIALAAFVFDAIVNWMGFPIVTDWEAFGAGLMIMDFSPIDWGNALRQFWNLFSVEIFVLMILGAFQWAWMHKQPD